MSIVIPGFFITTCFLLVTYGVFVGLLETSTDQNESVRLATEDQAGRLNTLVSIDSVSYTPCEYTATAQNKSDGISFGEFSEIDVFNRYSTSTGATLATRRAHDEGWYISSITPDNTNPNVWDPGERAGVSFGLSPLPQTGGNGTVAIAVPGGVSDSAYFEPFDCPFFWPFYWHNDPTPPTGDTASHAVLTTDDNHPTFTGDLPNYDTDRDAFAGLVVQKGGSGVGETDPTKYQVWRSGVLSEPLVTVGTIFIDFWAGLKDFQLNAKGQVTVFIRDRSATGDYTEIGSGTLADQDWQVGVDTFVKKTLFIEDVDYVVPAGHYLEAKVIVPPGSSRDMWLAYDTVTYPSVMLLSATLATYYPHSETLSTAGWWDQNWQNRRKITFDNSASTGDLAGCG